VDRIVGQLAGHGVLLAFGLSAGTGTGTAGEVGVGGGLLGGGVVGGGLLGGGVVGGGLLGGGVVGGGLLGGGLIDGCGGGLRNTCDDGILLLGVLSALVGVALPWVADGALEPTGLPEALVLPGPLPWLELLVLEWLAFSSPIVARS
jgi:hypothetical protein